MVYTQYPATSHTTTVVDRTLFPANIIRVQFFLVSHFLLDLQEAHQRKVAGLGTPTFAGPTRCPLSGLLVVP